MKNYNNGGNLLEQRNLMWRNTEIFTKEIEEKEVLRWSKLRESRENFCYVFNLRSKAVLHRGTEMRLVFKVF